MPASPLDQPVQLERRPAVVAGLGGVVRVASGLSHVCALRRSGEVACWGNGGKGATTLAPTSVPGIEGTVDVSVGDDFACATLGTGAVVCWSLSRRDGPTPMTGIASAVQVTAGRHACAATRGGEVLCWGEDTWGQLGRPPRTLSLSPVPLGVTGATRIVAGSSHLCAILGGGKVRCWGGFDVPRAGLDLAPRQRTGAAPREVSVSEGYACMLAGRGISCGPLGDPARPMGLLPRPLLHEDLPGAAGLTHLGAGFGRVCAVHGGGRVRCWGYDPRVTRRFGDDPPESAGPVDVAGLSDALRVSVGEWHACAVRRAGAVACWGRNDFGQLGVPQAETSGAVAAQGITDAADVEAGRGYTCALRRSGEVTCWGGGSVAGLGGAPSARAVPRAVDGLADAVQLAAGPYHACALRQSGEVACWGYNGQGAVGDVTTHDRAGPVTVPGVHDAAEVAAGTFHTCVRRRAGEISCWGRALDWTINRDRDLASYPPVKVVFEAPR